jgi:hypothetical protein
MHHLPAGTSHAPLRTEAQKVFKEPFSRYTDRIVSRKTSITGLQHIGFVMEAGPEEPIRNDFVRIYSNGEWVGEHFPWPPAPIQASFENFRNQNDHATGTYYTFCLEPPVSGRLPASEAYPAFFFIPDFEELRGVRSRLADPTSLYCPPHGFSDQLPNYARAQRRTSIAAWIHVLDMEVGVIRPARTIRKADLIDLLEQLASRVRSGVSRLRTLIFADVPTFLAIDLAYLLKDSRREGIWPNSQLAIIVLTQDWCVAYYTTSPRLNAFQVDASRARDFLSGVSHDFCAADVALLLRSADSRVFWGNVAEAYVNEQIKWGTREILGYLDLPQALVHTTCFHAAQRALRRALRTHRIDAVLTADTLVGSLLTDDFAILDGKLPLEHDLGREVVVAGSIKVTGSTTTRFRLRRDVSVRAIVHLLSRDDPISGAALHDGVADVIALEWSPRSEKATPVRARMYERIPETPFVIRGGERAIPLPRFAEQSSGTTYQRSYYGESPNDTYDTWQKQGLLKFGHWVYGGRHDLLTINLLEAINSDASGRIVSWLVSTLACIKRSTAANHDFILVYPSHVVTERIIRQLQSRSDNPANRILALKVVQHQSTSPFLVSPVERDRLGVMFRRSKMDTVVILFDDGTVTGKSLNELQQFVTGLWLQVHATTNRRRPHLDLRTVALLDRTGLPTHRRLVEEQVVHHPRLWRWDVPGLGNERSCTLCAALSRCRHLRDRIGDRDLAARLDLWMKHWRPLPVVGEWSEGGLLPDVLPADDTSHFCTEITTDGRVVAHHVRHRISTSRAALATEIFRSTTRRNYPLERAKSGLTGSGLSLSIQTRIEILCCSILLFLDDLSYRERLERFEVLLDLVWGAETASPATEIACLTLLLAEGTLAEDLARHMQELVETHEFRNDDAFLVASSLTWETGGRMVPKGRQNNVGWSLLRMVTSSRSGMRGTLSRIFQVIGWDEHSFHSGWLVHFFATTGVLRKPQDVQLVAIMLEELAAAFDELPIECVASWNDDTILPGEDAKHIRVHLARLRDLADFGDFLPLSNRYAQVCVEKPRELASVLQSIGEFLFGTGLIPGLRQQYRKYLTLRLVPDTARYLAIEKILVDVQDNWSSIQRGHIAGSDRRTPSAIVSRPPVFRSVPAFWETSCPIIYFDALVRQCLAELASNVMHSLGPIECPWPDHASGTADMWYRLEIEKSEAGDDWFTVEFCNSAADPLTASYRKGTIASRHLANLGGDIYAPRYDGGVAYVKVAIPAISALAWE